MNHLEPISRIDVGEGRLYFRGMNATRLAKEFDFETVLFLMIHEEFPDEENLSALKKRMHSFRESAGLCIPHNENEEVTLQPLAAGLGKIRDELGLSLYDSLLYFVSNAPFTVAAQWRTMNDLEIIFPREDLSHCANFLWMLNEKLPTKSILEDFQTTFILHLDDPANPSLTELLTELEKDSPVSQAILKAIRVQDTPLHHGAGYEVMKMLSRLREEHDLERRIRSMIKRGEKVFGMGHRIYKTVDPRASVLQEILEIRTRNSPRRWLYDLIREVTETTQRVICEMKGVTLFPNVDLYNAAVYSTLGVPVELNTALFATARTAGWMAHILDNLKE